MLKENAKGQPLEGTENKEVIDQINTLDGNKTNYRFERKEHKSAGPLDGAEAVAALVAEQRKPRATPSPGERA